RKVRVFRAVAITPRAVDFIESKTIALDVPQQGVAEHAEIGLGGQAKLGVPVVYMKPIAIFGMRPLTSGKRRPARRHAGVITDAPASPGATEPEAPIHSQLVGPLDHPVRTL